jgi:flavodoxin
MVTMKNLIICVSIHHGNTEKIAKAMAEILNAKLAKPNEVTMDDLSNYDLIGFGSGIYAGEHHETLLDFADKLSQLQNKKAFIFSTRGILPVRLCHKSLRKKLLEKKVDVIGEFSCRGLLTEWPFNVIGGISKNRPNKKDLENARKFARELKNKPGKG